MKEEWRVGRVIARPYVGKKRGEFVRTSNRHDYALPPTGTTALDLLKENGFDVRIIDYHYKGQDELYAIFKPIKSVKSLCRFIFTLINYRSLNEKKIKYRQFQKKYFLLTAEYTEVTQLYELNNQFEYFIAGSDQIWNICCPDFTDAYLLSFIPAADHI